VGQVFQKMGLHGSPTGELVLEDVSVPVANRLGAEGQGFTVAMRALDSGRIGISGQALGIGQAAVDEARDLMRERGHEQGDDFALADMVTHVASARLLAYQAAWLCSRGLPFTRQASMAKLHCTDTAMQVTLDALQIAGEEGARAGSPFDGWRETMEREGLAPVRARWLELADTIGRRVSVDGVTGVAVDLDVDGALVLEDGARRHRVVAGELEVV